MSGSMSHGQVRELARNLTDPGFYVFPTLHKQGDPNDKKPAGGNGFHDATTDPDEFEKMLPKRLGPGWHLGLGIHPGASGHIVFDPDVKEDGQGLKSLAWIESVYGPLPGRRVRTPSGGLHVWMTLPDGYTGEIGNKKAWPDIDTRCHNGYVIAPGVFVPWGSWTPESGTIGQIPAGVLAEIEAAHNEPKKIPTEATPGDRHESLVSIAAAYWAKGLNRDAVLHGIRGYNAEQCKPPKPDSELIGIVDWVVEQDGGPQPKYELRFPGGTDDEAPGRYIEPVDLLALMVAEPAADDWCIEPILPARKHTGIVATRGHGKSLLALDLAARKATGQAILSQPEGKPADVIYIDLEMGPDDLYERLADLGWTTDNPDFGKLVDHLHYYQLIDLPPLDTEAGGRELESIVDRHSAELIVIDTVSRVISGDENSSDTFRELFRHTETRLKRRGVTLARLDHLGKDVTKGSRGASGKEDALDVVWQLTQSVASGSLTLKLTKGRQAWIPPLVTIHRDNWNGTLSHTISDEPAQQWLVDLADLVDSLGIPEDAGIPTVQKALRDADQGRRRSDIAKAVRFRKGRAAAGTHSGNTPGTPPGNTSRNTPEHPPPELGVDLGLFDREHPREHLGTGKGVVSPPLGGNTPTPSELPDPH